MPAFETWDIEVLDSFIFSLLVSCLLHPRLIGTHYNFASRVLAFWKRYLSLPAHTVGID